MTSRANFSDAVCKSSTEFRSCWAGSKSVSEAACQTPKELYRFSETETQSGIGTQVIQDQVSNKNDGLSLLDHFCKLHPKQPREMWREGIARGKVTVDCEVVTNIDAPVSTDYFIEYVNVSSDKETQTVASSGSSSCGSSSSSRKNTRRSRRGDGKSSDTDADEYKYEDDYDEEDGKENLESENSSPQLQSSLQNLCSLVEAELSNNACSTAFQGYNLRGSARGDDDDDNDAEVQYWRCLSVDLEKRRVVYPDWSKARHALGRVSRCSLSRNGERLYDVEFDDGARQSGVREEHIRLIGEPPADSGLGLSGGKAGSKSGALSVAAPILREGIRVHAREPSARGSNNNSNSNSSKTKFLPGRVVKTHKSGRVDVEVEGGAVLKDLAVPDDVVAGLSEGVSVECRRPSRMQLQATGVSWNATGASVAASYGRTDITGWCDIPGAVCVWNLFGKGFSAEDPDHVLDHPSCLLCCAFHPLQPAVLAAGSFNGEVIVWDLSSNDVGAGSTAPRVSPIAEHVHKEPVVDLAWVRGGADNEWLLVSAGADGRVLFWNVAANGLSHPVLGATLSKGKASRRHYPPAHGASSLAFASAPSGRTAPWLLVGQEGGAVVRGQASRLLSSQRVTAEAFNAAQTSSDAALSLYPPLRRADEVFAHEPHSGPVNALACSPFSRNLFLSAGGDGTVRLCHLLETSPLRVWEPTGRAGGSGGLGSDSCAPSSSSSFAPITDAAFSPSRPLVFACASGSGELHLFDLAANEAAPVASLVPPEKDDGDAEGGTGSGAGSKAGPKSTARATRGSRSRPRSGAAPRTALTALAFNRKQRGLVAAADGRGRVHIWRLGWALTSGGGGNTAGGEAALLEGFEAAT